MPISRFLAFPGINAAVEILLVGEKFKMRRINPDYVRVVSETANRSPYFTLISMRLVSFAIGECRLEIDLGNKHLQPFGLVHGGVFSSIIDAAAFWAVYPEIDENSGMTSVDLKLNYLAPAQGGKLIAKGRRIKSGRTLGLGEAEVIDDAGRILAHGTSTLMTLPNMQFEYDGDLPPKFINM